MTRFRRSPQDGFIVIASDGLYDVMSNEETCRFVVKGLSHIAARANGLGESRLALQAVANKLVQFALSKGSQDNITAIIVLLQP